MKQYTRSIPIRCGLATGGWRAQKLYDVSTAIEQLLEQLDDVADMYFEDDPTSNQIWGKVISAARAVKRAHRDISDAVDLEEGL